MRPVPPEQAVPPSQGAQHALASQAAAKGGAGPLWLWHGLALAAVLLLILISYRDTAATMVGIWMRSETFAHAFVVPPISFWLIWRQRAALWQTTPRAVPWLGAAMAALAAVWALGELVATNAATQLMLTTMLVAAVPAVLGWQSARTIMFPLGFLFFAVPIGEFLTPLLMQYTADFTVAALRATGVPVYREGLQFVIPSGHWSVVEACSGIRYLMASLMAGTLFAYLNYRSHTRRWVFVGVSIAVPIVANWLRAYMIVMLGHLSDNRIATGVDHLLYGWVFFGVVIMLMFYIGARWSEPDTQLQAADPAAVPGLVGLHHSARLLLACALVAIATGWAPLWVQHAQAISSPAAHRPLALPQQWASGVPSTAGQLPAWKPRFVNPSASDQREYASDSGPIGLYIGHYQGQTAERKLVSSENVLVHSEDLIWNQLSAGRASVQLRQGELVLRAATLSGPPDTRLSERPRLRVWQLYWVDGQFIGSDWRAKLAQARQVLAGGGDAGAALVVYTKEEASGKADARLAAFLSANEGEVDRLLRALRRD